MKDGIPETQLVIAQETGHALMNAYAHSQALAAFTATLTFKASGLVVNYIGLFPESDGVIC